MVKIQRGSVQRSHSQRRQRRLRLTVWRMRVILYGLSLLTLILSGIAVVYLREPTRTTPEPLLQPPRALDEIIETQRRTRPDETVASAQQEYSVESHVQTVEHTGERRSNKERSTLAPQESKSTPETTKSIETENPKPDEARLMESKAVHINIKENTTDAATLDKGVNSTQNDTPIIRKNAPETEVIPVPPSVTQEETTERSLDEKTDVTAQQQQQQVNRVPPTASPQAAVTQQQDVSTHQQETVHGSQRVVKNQTMSDTLDDSRSAASQKTKADVLQATPVTKTTPAPHPVQHPKMFLLIADSRSGSDWIMNGLDRHPQVCASGEFSNEQMGFPSGVLLPDGMSWFPDSDLRQGCIFAFIKVHVYELLGTLERCEVSYNAEKDDLRVHLPRLCTFARQVQPLTSNQTAVDLKLMELYTGAFATDNDELVPCKCPPSTKIRGIKVMSDWRERLPGLLEHHESIKVIRMRRKNLFSRYMSMRVAMESGVWQTSTLEDKERQLNALPSSFSIDLDDMMSQFHFTQLQDQEADQWAESHISENDSVLGVDYEHCRDDAATCFRAIFDYLGIDDAESFIGAHAEQYRSPFERSPIASPEMILERTANTEIVKEALGAGGYGSFIGYKSYQEIQHLQIIEFDEAKHMVLRTPPHETAINTTTIIIGDKTKVRHKFEAVSDALAEMDEGAFVVVSFNDRRAKVGINPHLRSHSTLYASVASLRSRIQSLNGKVLVSASDICCASALSHVEPGTLVEFDEGTGGSFRRKVKACRSGDPTCRWNDENIGLKWRDFMRSTAINHFGISPQNKNVYLDGNLLGGRAVDLRNLFETLLVDPGEDERAVLTEYFFRSPDSLLLDYQSSFFGRDFPGVQNVERRGCFLADEKKYFSRAAPTSIQPLFVHTERELGCVEASAAKSQETHFPRWADGGMKIDPILDHIDNKLVHNHSLRELDPHFGPEIFYVVTGNGLWASQVKRDKYRVQPTEKFLVRTLNILRSTSNIGRWARLSAVINESGFPYWAWYGDYRSCCDKNAGEASVPLFTTCALRSCNYALPSPAYMTIIDAQEDTRTWFSYFQRYDRDFSWRSKIRKAVWRGSLSESDPSKVFQSERWRLCQLVSQRMQTDADIFDVGFTHVPEFLSSQLEIDVSKIGGLKPSISPMVDFQRYIAILDLDGNSWSSRFSSLLCYNSVVVKVEPEYQDYFFPELVPWKHYIPVKSDLSDLVENVSFATDEKNDHIVKEIVASANQWCAERFVKDQVSHDQLDLWQAYVTRLDQGDPKWAEKWSTKRRDMFARPNDYKLLNLSQQQLNG